MVPAGQWARSRVPKGMWTFRDLAEQWGLSLHHVRELVQRSGVEYGVKAYCAMGPGGRKVTRRLALFTPETVEYLTRWRAGYRLPQVAMRPAKEPRRKKT